jgi:hypothetical protein
MIPIASGADEMNVPSYTVDFHSGILTTGA